MRLRYLTAGESHGPALTGILEGLPSGLSVTEEDIAFQLSRRQLGFGRSGRMKIEKDVAQILAGVRFGKTLGSPVSLLLPNKDFASWTQRMSAAPGGPDDKPVSIPRPGHADFAGALKYGHLHDMRNVLERASARETAMRVALGTFARNLLRELGVTVGSYVTTIGGATGASATHIYMSDAEALSLRADASPTRAFDEASTSAFIQEIEKAQSQRDTVGGTFEVIVSGLPAGLGSYVHWDRRLDGRLAQAIASIPAVKAVELGDGFQQASVMGTKAHDAFSVQQGEVKRASNHAGGLEGGVTNGQPLVLRAAMKPISTVSNALPSFHVQTLEQTPAHVERSDTCAVPAAAIIAESMVCLTLADAILETLGGDTLSSLRLPFARLRLATRAVPSHVFLAGPMGSGKTSTGRLLALKLDLPFVDLDNEIENKNNARVADIFSKEGEAAFRAMEWAALEEVVSRPPSVVALGGGTALTEKTWALLRSNGLVLGLKASEATLKERLGKEEPSRRPLLSQTTLGELLERRARWYEKADATIESDLLSPEDVASWAFGVWHLVRSKLGRQTE